MTVSSSAPEAKPVAAAALKAPRTTNLKSTTSQQETGKRSTKPDNGKASRTPSKSPRRKRVNQQCKSNANAATAGKTVTDGAATTIAVGASTNNRNQNNNNNTNNNRNKRPGKWKRGEGKMCRATDAKPYAAAPKPAPAPVMAQHHYQPSNILQTKTIPLQNCKMLHWKSPHPHVPLAIEVTILEYLFVSSPKREGLLLRDEPNSDARYLQIQQACLFHNMPVSAALSLRQETVHWKNKNPNLRPAGFDQKVRKSAELFEVAVEQFMLEQLQGQGSSGGQVGRVPEFWTEDDQREHNKRHSHPPMPTPDILFCESVCCRRYVDVDSEEGEEMEDIVADTDRMDEDNAPATNANNSKNRKVIEEGIIHWCDAKMMYGSSTIPQNNKCAVGKILKTAQKYVKWFGPGALCFMHGCGESLAAELAAIGVMALDCSSRQAVNIDAVEEHQRTWCGDKNGQIVM